MKKEEVWKDIYIDGEISPYQISNWGNVYSLHSHRELIPHIDSYGYAIVGLYFKGKTYHKKVHRLVLEYFNESDVYCFETVNHINGDRCDNYIENLEYATVEYNNWHFRNVLNGEEQEQKACKEIEKKKEKVKEIEEKFNNLKNPRNIKELDEEELKEIIEKVIEGHCPYKNICVEYNVSYSTLKNIQAGVHEGRGKTELLYDELYAICDDVFNSNLSLSDIAKKHNVKRSVVSSFHYKSKQFEYIWKLFI